MNAGGAYKNSVIDPVGGEDGAKVAQGGVDGFGQGLGLGGEGFGSSPGQEGLNSALALQFVTEFFPLVGVFGGSLGHGISP